MFDWHASRRTLAAALRVAAGALLMWSGGFVLSSNNSLCEDGPAGHRCSGTFTSAAWQVLGLGLVVVGVVVVVAAVASAVVARSRLTR